MDLIDYTGNSTEDDPTNWKPAAFKKYFMETYWKIHKVGGAVPWAMKERSLFGRMYQEFSRKDIADMILYWHTTTPKASVACQFVNFYNYRVEVYHKMKKASGEYSWE